MEREIARERAETRMLAKDGSAKELKRRAKAGR